jgi:type VI secretion system protein ImpH
MASANGREGAPLSERLLGEPFRFDFFQAVRLVERLARERAAEDSRWPAGPLGQDWGPEQEAIRFRALPTMSFPAGPVSKIQNRQPPAREDSPEAPLPPPEMEVAFLGLTGPQGVLPQHYTTLLLRRIRDKDYALRDFFDLFHHRTVSLFYRAWEKYRLPFAYERSRQDGTETIDLCTFTLYCLVGLGTEGQRGRLDVDDEAFLYYGGHFAHFPRCAVSLEALLEDYLGIPLRVEQARGQWLVLDENDCSRMPGLGLPDGQNNQLGVSLIAGGRVWDAQSKFRLRLGPVSYAQFRRYMPDGDGLRTLAQLARSYVGPDLDFDVQVLLEAPEVPWCRLGDDGPDGPRLGWNAWVRCRDFEQPVGDAVFSVDGL